MKTDTHSLSPAETFGLLTIESFRLNGLLLTHGDRMSAPHGMTSARWQVLGTLMLADQPLTVAETARRMGLARQSVQRIADWLKDAGLLRYEANPAHPRWQRARPTARGKKIYRQLEAERLDWAQHIAARIDPAKLTVALEVLQQLRTDLTITEPTSGATAC